MIPGDHSATTRVNGVSAGAAGSEARPFAASPFGKGAPLASAAVAAGAPARWSAAAAAAWPPGSGGHGSAAATPTMLRPSRVTCHNRKR